MLRSAQVVTAFDAVAALAADDAARSEPAKFQQPQQNRIEQGVDYEAGPEWAEWEGSIVKHFHPMSFDKPMFPFSEIEPK